MSNEEINGSIEKLQQQVYSLREVNSKLVQEIEQRGGQVDLSMARIEHFIQRLIDIELLAEETAWTEQLDWEMHLKRSLINVRDMLREKDAQQQPQRKPPQRKLWTPGR